MNKHLVPSIIAFRAANFLIGNYAIRFNSESLQMLNMEMEPAVGHPSGDPALAYSWKKLWGETDLRTREGAATVASDYIDLEGAWGKDDEHRRLANELRNSAKVGAGDMWQEWCYFLGKARDYADPGAWMFSDDSDNAPKT